MKRVTWTTIVIYFFAVGLRGQNISVPGANMPVCNVTNHAKTITIEDPDSYEDCNTGGGTGFPPHDCTCYWDGATGVWLLHTHSSIDNDLVINESGAAVDFRIEGDTKPNLFVTDGSADEIGIGTADPDGTLHVMQASAGTVTAGSAGNTAVFEAAGNNGISILVPDANRANVNLGTESDNVGAFLQWDFTADLFSITTANVGAEIVLKTANQVGAVWIDSDQRVGINDSLPASRFHVTLDSDEAVCIETSSGTCCNYGELTSPPSSPNDCDEYTDTSGAKCFRLSGAWTVVGSGTCA